MTFNIIEYITKNTDLKQKDLAKKLGVTTGQISKWKQGEYISSERKEELNKLAGLFAHHAEWAVLSKTKENSDLLIEYVLQLSSKSDLSDRVIEDLGDWIIPNIFILLSQIGISIPDKTLVAYDLNQINFDNLLTRLLQSYSVLNDWNNRYLHEISSDQDILDIVDEIKSKTLNVALIDAYRLDSNILISMGANKDLLVEFTYKTKHFVRELIQKLLRKMNSKRLPITVDYFLFINQNTDWLKLMMSFSEEGDEINEFLTYAERTQLEIKQYETELLESLHKKVNVLLSNEKLNKLNKNNGSNKNLVKSFQTRQSI